MENREKAFPALLFSSSASPLSWRRRTAEPERLSPCSPSSSSPTSSVQVLVPLRLTGPVTPAPSVLPRVAVPMVTVLQGSVYVASSTPQHVAPPSPPTPPTSGTRDTPAATLPLVHLPVLIL